MPKRTSDKIEYYNSKIRKLQKRDEVKKRRRVIVYSSSSDSEEQIENGTQVDEHNRIDGASSEPPLAPSPPVVTSIDEVPLQEPVVPELDPELLEALGAASDDNPVYGPDIHETLAQRWLPILKKGLQAEAKEKLLKEYNVPSNCKLLKAPALNPEISAAVLDIVRNRDKKIQTKQDQLGLGISAVNKAMTLLLTSDDKVQAIKILSDCCRILTDLHYTETQVRTKLITPGLEKSFFTLIQDQERDETLFGTKLSEKIKASKAIEKQGLQIKKNINFEAFYIKYCTVDHSLSEPGKLVRSLSLLDVEKGGANQLLQGVASVPPTDVHAASCSPGFALQVHQLQQACSFEAVNQDNSTSSEAVYPGSSSALRTAFKTRGSPDQALELMMASLSKNTLEQYSVTFKLWWHFCNVKNVNPFLGSSSNVMIFLTELFDQGASYGSINSHRSALTLLLGNNVTSVDMVKRLLKGVYKLRPASPKYTHTWNPQTVLNYIANWVPNNEISFEKLTKKLVVLLALCTAHRVQTLSLIKLDNIIVNSSGIQIGITDVIKTSAAGREQPVLVLPFFNENRAICPASIIENYIFRSSHIRSEMSRNLILTHKKPHKPATAQSISRWIKQVLAESGVDVATFNAHSTRHAATSTARASGLSLDAIRKAAGWTSSSQSFAKFYNLPIVTQDDFARSVLRPNVSE